MVLEATATEEEVNSVYDISASNEISERVIAKYLF